MPQYNIESAHYVKLEQFKYPQPIDNAKYFKTQKIKYNGKIK